jgi:regulator of protease activity HflC (stomatin/prohibitin superfamily)
MGLFVNDYIYFQSLHQRQDLELQKQLLRQRKFYIINVTTQLTSEMNKLDPGSEGYKVLDLRQMQMNQMTQVLDAEIARMDQQQQEVNVLLQTSQQALGRDIQSAFSYASTPQG